MIKLPSQFQPREKANYSLHTIYPKPDLHIMECNITAVTFTEHGKVLYDIELIEFGTTLERVESDLLTPCATNCTTNTPEVQEFLELSSVPVETDNIDVQKLTKPTWQSLTSLQDGETLS